MLDTFGKSCNFPSPASAATSTAKTSEGAKSNVLHDCSLACFHDANITVNFVISVERLASIFAETGSDSQHPLLPSIATHSSSDVN